MFIANSWNFLVLPHSFRFLSFSVFPGLRGPHLDRAFSKEMLTNRSFRKKIVKVLFRVCLHEMVLNIILCEKFPTFYKLLFLGDDKFQNVLLQVSAMFSLFCYFVRSGTHINGIKFTAVKIFQNLPFIT